MLIPPTVQWDDAPLKCLTVNDEWVSFLTGLLAAGEQDFYWDGDINRGVQNIRRIIENLQGSNCIVPEKTIAHLEHIVIGGGAGGGYINGGNVIPANFGGVLDATYVALPNPIIAMQATLQPGRYHITGWHNFVAHNTNNTAYVSTAFFGGLAGYPHAGVFLANQRAIILIDQIITLAAATLFTWQVQTNQARATNGFGVASGLAFDDGHGFLSISLLP